MSSRSLNKVLLIGNLTRDPELRYTPQGTPVCTFGLATNRSWQPSAGGERQEETEFHRIVAWNKLAELCSELLFKGRKVFVEGRIQTRNWTDAQGQERTTVEVVIDNMIVLDNKRKDGQPGEEGAYEQKEYAAETPQPSVEPAPAEEVPTVPAEEEKPKAKTKKVEKKEEPAEPKVNPDDIPF
ncbi:MAG: single-stranded DNA-binding protein [Candidatus Beckwithbacteria bacterium]|nr:single-stranded DNA-binding protein [Candidatus Beckwithbacteria bacterium]